MGQVTLDQTGLPRSKHCQSRQQCRLSICFVLVDFDMMRRAGLSMSVHNDNDGVFAFDLDLVVLCGRPIMIQSDDFKNKMLT